jgi:16S rRNA (uracil1498-N3)-methyltransferase
VDAQAFDPAPPRAAKRRPPAVFLELEEGAEPPSDGQACALLEGEAEHLVKVLRVRPGAALLGLDGRGLRLPLEVERVDKRRLEVTVRGVAVRDPAPGQAGAPLPRIELAAAWPSEARGDALLDQATQLGVAALRPLLAERSSGRRGAPRAQRAERLIREACKQCDRSWLPAIQSPATPVEAVAEFRERAAEGQVLLTDPSAATTLAAALRRAPRDAPRLLLVGPEGGFSQAELDAMHAAGALPVRLGPHVLRIATAAESALAIAASALEAPGEGP